MSTEMSSHFVHLLQVSKKISLKSDFIHFFHGLLHVSPGQRQTVPRGQHFDVNKNTLSLFHPFVTIEKISLKSDLIQFFSCFNTGI